MANMDQGLIGNEKIEEAIYGLQQESSQEMLAHALTVLRRRMRENGQLIVMVDPAKAMSGLSVQYVKSDDGKLWLAAFTSFEEQLKGDTQVMSTFLADMSQLFKQALTSDDIEGIIINPWNRTIMLNKALIQIILGNQ